MILNTLKLVRKRILENNKQNIKNTMLSQQESDIHVINENLALSKAELASELGVSRPTLNAAIEALQAQGQIENIMKSGNRFLLDMEHCQLIAEHLDIQSWEKTIGTTHVIPVSSLKGGTGKSTVTINLASALSIPLNEGKRVLVIDLDPQGSCRNNAQPDMEKESDILTAVDLMLAEYEKDETYNDYHKYTSQFSHTDLVRFSCQRTQYVNLDILPSFTTDERFTEFVYSHLSNDMDTARSLLKTKVIDHLVDVYDVIFIDCPPTMLPIVENALEAATGLIVPVSPKKLDWAATILYFDKIPGLLEKLPSQGKNLGWFKVLLNNVEHEHNRDSKMVATIQNSISAENMMLKAVDRSSAFEVASQNFRTVVDMRPKDNLVPNHQLTVAKSSITNVSRELTGILKQQEGY